MTPKRFETLAQQDGKRPDKGRCVAGCIGRQCSFGIGEKGFDCGGFTRDRIDRHTSRDGHAIIGHRGFDLRHKGGIARRQDRLNRFETVEIGGQRETLCLAPISLAVRGKALRQFVTGNRKRRGRSGCQCLGI